MREQKQIMTNEGTNKGKNEIKLTELTIEQLFKLKVYADQTQLLTAEEAQILLIEMMRQNMVTDNVIKHLRSSSCLISAMLKQLVKFYNVAIEPFCGTDNKTNL